MGWRKQFWRSWLFDPLINLLRCFFQPAGFQKDLERGTIPERLQLMLHFIFPLFLSVYPLALLLRILVYWGWPSTYLNYHLPGLSGIFWFAFDCLWAVALSCSVGGLFGSIFSIVYGVALALALGLAGGIIVNNLDDTVVAVVFGISFGCIFGLTFNSVGAIKHSGLLRTTLGTGAGMLSGIGVGILAGTFGGYWAGWLAGLIGGPGLEQTQSILPSIAGLIVGGISGSLVVRITGSIIRSITDHPEVVEAGTRIGVAVAGAFGVAVATPVADVGARQQAFLAAIPVSGTDVLLMGTAFLLSYIPSYYRLPLYPLNALSMLKAYLSSSKYPQKIFYNLQHCALHCDECVFLPLPYTRPLLSLAAEQNIEYALEEMNFLLLERLQQRDAIQGAVLELALHDLCLYESLRDLSRVHQRLQITLPQEVRLLDPRVGRLFRNLEDASRDAASYYSRTNRRAREDALKSVLSHLQRVYPGAIFREPALNRSLEELVQRWKLVSRHELENLAHDHDDFGYIINPYVPGLVLELRDPLFVGRQDLAQQLGEALLRARRPTFFLSGERRMGKSSILKQLPDLLGSQYLPIFYDLQMTGIASSTAALLAAIAEGIYDLLIARGLPLKKLEYEQLREDQRENEAVAYYRFGRWLREVEQMLEREGRVLLLAFDEFEKLEEAGLKGHLDLLMLLDWLRSSIQNRPRVALLFSGVKTVSEMGSKWSGYFVNVETLKVSFLQRSEAERLILHPVSNFPGESIFNKEIVDAIIQETGCHPFLIQALCSSMITRLNASTREEAQVADVAEAVEEVFLKWGDNYFRDLWERTEDEQRLCLQSLLQAERASYDIIQEHSGLSGQVVRRALQLLQKRDILVEVQGTYSFAAPIFKLWVERSI